MALTAKEWLLLPENEQQRRCKELADYECFLLRNKYAYIHFTEEEKRNMTEEEKLRFAYPIETEFTPLEKQLTKMTIAEQIEYIFNDKKNG